MLGGKRKFNKLGDPTSFSASGLSVFLMSHAVPLPFTMMLESLEAGRGCFAFNVVLLLLLMWPVSIFRDLHTAGCFWCTMACVENMRWCFCYLFMLLCDLWNMLCGIPWTVWTDTHSLKRVYCPWEGFVSMHSMSRVLFWNSLLPSSGEKNNNVRVNNAKHWKIL